MGKDKSGRLLETEESFFIFYDQVVCGNVIVIVFSALYVAVNAVSGFFIDTEISVMNLFNVPLFQIVDVVAREKTPLFLQN